jgi:predicted ATPase/DNA-binding XRE family transcriptional regulator
MKAGVPRSFGAQLKALRESAGFTQEELATISGLSSHAISALERGERRRPHVETVRALSAALDLTGTARAELLASARSPKTVAIDEPGGMALPEELTALVGREIDIQTLRQWLADRSARLITLIGPGGVGKTRLALEVARAIADAGSFRVVFVELAVVRDHAFVVSAIAEALGLADVTALDLPRRARARCEGHDTLLLLDNFEHILDAAPLVTDLLTSVPSLRVLATSRAPLRLRGEREYAVGPLGLGVDADAMSPPDLALVPAVRLFVERVRDAKPDFRLTSANAPAIIAICRRLDALPLALELAAPWIKTLDVEGLRRRLEHDVLLSTRGPRDLPERQQTMNATVEWSYRLLGSSEQRMFRRLGALAGPFPIDAAAAVVAGREASAAGTKEVLRGVVSMIDKSLVLRSETAVPARPMFRMLETIRTFAALELTSSHERDDAMEGLVRYCSGEASLAARGLVGSAQVEWLNRVREDLESYRSTLPWLIERGRSSEASTIACGLMWFFAIRGYAAEGLQWYEQILHLASLPVAAESRTLAAAGQMFYSQGKIERARDALGRAMALAAGVDLETLAQSTNLYGHMERSLGNLEAARGHLRRGVEVFRTLRIPWGMGSGLNGLAAVALATGDEAEAERLLDEGASAHHHAGPWFLTLGLLIRAMIAVRRGEPDKAITVMRESLTHLRELQDKFAFVYALVLLSTAAALKGDDTWAARILGARDAVGESTGATVVDRSILDLRDATERGIRARLGPERWARAYAAGRGLSIDALLNDIEKAGR